MGRETKMINMKSLLLNIFLIVCFALYIGCNNDNVSEKARIPELDSTDYEIISAALDNFLIQYKTGSYAEKDKAYYDREYSSVSEAEVLMIPELTDFEPLSNMKFENRRDFDSSEHYIARRFPIENSIKYRIDNSRITTFKTYMLPQSERDADFKKLYSEFPDAWGIAGFSKPSYTTNREKAVIYIYYHKSGKRGKALYMWLIRQNGRWIQYDIIDSWVS